MKKTKKLTAKQTRFCKEYVYDWNATRSAIAAGYSKKTARAMGWENLTKPYIIAYIEEIKDDFEKNLHVSKQMFLNKLKNIALASFTDINETWITRKEYEELSPEIKDAIQEIRTRTRHVVEKIMGKHMAVVIEEIQIKLHNQPQAIAEFFKAVGWNAPKKIELSGHVVSGNPFEEMRKNAGLDEGKD